MALSDHEIEDRNLLSLSYLSSQLPEHEHLAVLSLIFIFKHAVNIFFRDIVPKCFPCKPAVTPQLAKETELYSKTGGKVVLNLLTIVLEGHFEGHY